MVVMENHRFVVTTESRAHVPIDVFPIKRHLNQELQGNSAQKFSTIVVCGVYVASFHPSNLSLVSSIAARDDSGTTANIIGDCLVVGTIAHHHQSVVE
jgi:hypothetical protein